MIASVSPASPPSLARLGGPAGVILGVSLIIALLVPIFGEDAMRAEVPILAALSNWTPLLAKGFAVDVALATAAMALGTVVGVLLGALSTSKNRLTRSIVWSYTQLFRNIPGLVLLFAFAFALPYNIEIGPVVIPFPAEAKVIVSFGLKIAANVAELVRGAVAAVPSGQWEACTALGLKRFLTFRLIILPQCVRRMAPPWMNVAAIFFTAVPVASLVGIYDAVAYAGLALRAEGNSTLIIPIYTYVLTWFFGVAYALQGLTQRLEARQHVVSQQ